MKDLIHTYAFSPRPGAIPTGRFASNPIRKLEIAEMAAVAVMRSLRTSFTQARYVVSETQPSPVGHSQVPPVSERMAALTDIFEQGNTSGYCTTQKAGYDGRCTPLPPEGKTLVVSHRSYIGICTSRTHPCRDACTDFCLGRVSDEERGKVSEECARGSENPLARWRRRILRAETNARRKNRPPVLSN